jgi:XTP/dITP diphosphohydrolase
MTAPLRRSSALEDFADQMRVLQRECAWKREQTHTSLIPYVREEAEEVVEAIESGDPAALCDELGDLLLQVVIHAVIAEEAGDFTLDDVARGITAKMRRRNPHVFGADGERPVDAAAVNDAWQEIKAAERPGSALTAGLPRGLPALLHADKVLDRLERRGTLPAGAGTDPGTGAGLGDRLLALVAEARATGADPEQELRDAVRRMLAAAARG